MRYVVILSNFIVYLSLCGLGGTGNSCESKVEVKIDEGRKDSVFIISNFKSKYPMLQLDLRFSGPLIFGRASHQEKIKNVTPAQEGWKVMFFCVVSLRPANWDRSRRVLHVYRFQEI
ncbi:uncharacterized protein LOC125476030 isoform X2 [Pyrus x bretschneideri]|uniref:uncharacterized protein LOC125476030 isoform X2 n=1 Tax=Pyrus x bretschneideri TaxID=225117 RepID=UPI00202E8200|nr:uncharacterized protein LOC125476030 isoform X2 [Pyrus x bretschneideri]